MAGSAVWCFAAQLCPACDNLCPTAGESQSFPRIDSFKGSYTYSNSGETWVEVGRERVYTPAADDVGAILKFECTAYDAGG